MKKERGLSELLDIIFSEKVDKKRLMKLGFTEEDAETFLKMLYQDNTRYMRILNREERDSFSPDAIIYLLSLLQSESITREEFEHVITLCIQIVYFTNKKIDKHNVDNVLNFVIFNEAKDVSIKEMIELFFMQEYEIDFDDEVH